MAQGMWESVRQVPCPQGFAGQSKAPTNGRFGYVTLSQSLTQLQGPNLKQGFYSTNIGAQHYAKCGDTERKDAVLVLRGLYGQTQYNGVPMCHTLPCP